MIIDSKHNKYTKSEYFSNFYCKDESLAEIVRFIQKYRNEVKVISFDFFDTLVYRTVPEPYILFKEVGRELIIKGNLKVKINIEEFAKIRQEAEQRARNKSYERFKTFEITLNDIYKQLSAILLDINDAINTEILTESKHIYINPSIVSFIYFLKEIGIKIIIISDTYFSANELLTILKYNNFDIALLDGIFVSSEFQCGKWDGKLFDVVIDSLGINPKEIIHIGDNFESDFKLPLLKGMYSLHYYRTNPYHDKIFEREYILSRGYEGITFSLNSLRIFAQRTITKSKNIEYKKLGAFILGPVFSRFADWAVNTFKQRGVKKVLALMREGEVLKKLLDESAQFYGIDLTVIPFYASRYSTTLAACGKPDLEIIRKGMSRRFAPSVSEILEGFGLSNDDIQIDEDMKNVKVNNNAIRERVEKFILKIGDIVKEKSKLKRDEFMSYFLQFYEGEEKIGLIDLGWGGTIQSNIGRIIKLEGLNIKLIGCYLATGAKASYLMMDGMEVYSYLNGFGSNELDNCLLLRSPEIIEQSIIADIGTTIGYKKQEDKVKPILKNIMTTKENTYKKKAIQEGILYFQKLWLSLLKEKKKDLLKNNNFLEDIDYLNRIIINRLIGFPTKMEAELFGSLYHDDNFGSNNFKKICSEDEIELFKNEGIFGLYKEAVYWPQGTICKIRPDIIDKIIDSWKNLHITYGKQGIIEKYKGYETDLTSEEKVEIMRFCEIDNPFFIVLINFNKGDILWFKENMKFKDLVAINGNIKEIDNKISKIQLNKRNTLFVISKKLSNNIRAYLRIITKWCYPDDKIILFCGNEDIKVIENGQLISLDLLEWMLQEGIKYRLKLSETDDFIPLYITILTKNN